VAERAVEALGALQRVAPTRALASEQPRSPLEDLERWVALARRAGEDGGAADALAADLRRTAPPLRGAVIAHGDFHYGNLLFADGRVSAILDWEIAGVGDPLSDLAGLVVASLRARYVPDPNPTGTVEVGVEELCSWYGVAGEPMRWWVAETCLKYSAIIAYNRMLHRRGKRVDAIYERLDRTIEGLVLDGRSILEGGFEAVAGGC
jgi:prepilin-type processing-associated H-X9-DG protein